MRSPQHGGVPLEAMLEDAALRGETAIAIIRGLFVLAVLGRFFLLGITYADEHVPMGTALVVGPSLLALGFSAVYLLVRSRRRASARWLAPSVTLDAAVCFALLLSNVLWPGSLYRGILLGPDVAAVLLITIASGLRLSVPLAVLGAGANLALTGVLIVLDHALAPAPLEYGWPSIVMWGILLLGAGGLAGLSAWRTRKLAYRSALESTRLQRTRGSLQALLHGHHDADSLVSSLSLTADLLARTAGETDEDVASLVGSLQGDVRVLRQSVRTLKTSADGELTASLEPETVDVAAEAPRIIERARPSLGDLGIDVRVRCEQGRARIAGGDGGLARVLANLLRNARKGDERGRATHVRVVVEPCDPERAVRLVVDDDGPGWPARGRPPPGRGVGLQIVRGIVEASGGTMHLDAAPDGGARVQMSFPRP